MSDFSLLKEKADSIASRLSALAGVGGFVGLIPVYYSIVYTSLSRTITLADSF